MYVHKVIIGFLLFTFSNVLLAASPCNQDATHIADISYCQIANQLNKPARWVDGIFAAPGQTPQGTTRATIVNSTDFFSDGTLSNATLLKLRWTAPHFEDKFRIQFTTSQMPSRTQPGSDTASIGAAPKFTTAIMSALSTTQGSAQIGLGLLDTGRVVILTQASLPWVYKKDRNTFGVTPRIRWNRIEGTSWHNLLFLDHEVSSETLLGFDNNSALTLDTQEGFNTSAVRAIQTLNAWEFQATVAAHYIYEADREGFDYWTSISADHSLGRPWFRGQIVPALHWKLADAHLPTTQVTFNFIVDFFQ